MKTTVILEMTLKNVLDIYSSLYGTKDAEMYINEVEADLKDKLKIIIRIDHKTQKNQLDELSFDLKDLLDTGETTHKKTNHLRGMSSYG